MGDVRSLGMTKLFAMLRESTSALFLGVLLGGFIGGFYSSLIGVRCLLNASFGCSSVVVEVHQSEMSIQI